MNQRNGILLFFVLALGSLIFYQIQQMQQARNTVDYLTELAVQLEDNLQDVQTIYYISNTPLEQVYYQTQFAFAPKVVTKKAYEKIPSQGIILALTDLAKDSLTLDFQSANPDTTTITQVANSFYKINLIEKQ